MSTARSCRLTTIGGSCRWLLRRRVDRAKIDKGHRAELEALVRAIRHGGDWPIPLWQQLQATEIALQVQAALVSTGMHDDVGSSTDLPVLESAGLAD